MVNSKFRAQKEDDPEFMPYPKDESKKQGESDSETNALANRALVLQFVKSPLAVNPGMVKSLLKTP